jgi:2-dehydro-3-deoxygluconokinase
MSRASWPPDPRPLGAQLDLVGFGEALILLQPPAGQQLADAGRLEVHVAGAELNACAAVSCLGGRTVLCTRLGLDPFAERVGASAARLGVAVAADTDPARPTAVFFKDALADGLRRVHYYRAGSAASAMSIADARRGVALEPRSVLLSGLTLALGPGPASMVLEVAARAAAHGCAVVVDANLRPQLGDLDRTVAALRGILSSTDLLVIGVDEARAVFGTAHPAEIRDRAAAAGCREVVITAGAEGCWWMDAAGEPHRQPSLASAVVDPIGAGDAFTGGYLAARLVGKTPEHAALVGSRLAAGVAAATGDTGGLPTRAAARLLLKAPAVAGEAAR